MRISTCLVFLGAAAIAIPLTASANPLGRAAAAPRPPTAAGFGYQRVGARQFGSLPIPHWITPLGNPPMPRPNGRMSMRPDNCAGNRLYFADQTASVIDSFGPNGGSVACTVTAAGLAGPVGLWVNPQNGPYHNMLFAANYLNHSAVAYTTPLTNASTPTYQFNTGTGLAAGDAVQDVHGVVYVSEFSNPWIDVYKPPFTNCVYPTGCAPTFSMIEPCGFAYWLATDDKGDVYSDNFCGTVSLYRPPMTANKVGTTVAGITYNFPGGMILERPFHLLVSDQGNPNIGLTGTITSYNVNVGNYTATVNHTLAPINGDIVGIGLPQINTFIWGSDNFPTEGQRFHNVAGGLITAPVATDSTLVPFTTGAAARPSSAD